MRKGKIAAQASHAATGRFTRGPDVAFRRLADGRYEMVVQLDEEAYCWLQGQYRKICVAVHSEAELLELHEKALAAGLRSTLVKDNGLTEFAGVPTYTALAIGPHLDERVDPLTKHLTPL